MQLPVAFGVLAGLIVLSGFIGLALRRSAGRVRPTRPRARRVVHPHELGDGIRFGSAATLVQFSTAFCGSCPATRRLLGELAQAAGVAHVDLDVTDDVDLAARFGILQTPTTLLLDGAGRQVARIGGPPRRIELEQHLATLTTSPA
jgi:thiol-disulfide isomerase/thioredoxin